MTENSIQESTNPKKNFSCGAGIAGLLLLFILILLTFGLLQTNRGPLKIGEPVPDFVLTTFDGDRIDTSELRGQVILVNIWASWCVTCVYEAKDLEEAYQMYRDQGVVFLGVDWSDTDTKALEYLERFGITYLNGPDLEGRIYKDYRVRGVPETFIIDPNGNLSSMKIGAYASLEDIVRAIEFALDS
jgi:cytochrome c biogenesis protein CcmG/thiol:disulfide interchange protein DsbE